MIALRGSEVMAYVSQLADVPIVMEDTVVEKMRVNEHVVLL
jgi:hypothetical protein